MLDFKFYKPTTLSCFPSISNILLEKHKDKFNTNERGAVLLPWTQENFLDLYDEINSLVNPKGCHVTVSRFFITPPNGSIGVHVDSHELNPNAYALNIPILVDSKDHVMNWFDYDGEIFSKVTPTYNKAIAPLTPEKLQLVKSYLLIEPSYVQVGIFHEVLNTSDLPRIVLSIRFSNSFKLD